ncbi:hypothetical protein IMM1_36500 [Pseudocoprococcus immobilis]
MLNDDTRRNQRYQDLRTLKDAIMNRLIIICGKTNSGKSTLKNALLQHGFESIVTYTTRSPRLGEVNGVDYHFISEEEFENLKKGQLLEWSGYTKDGQIVQVGSSKESYMQPGKHVAILDAAGLKALKDSKIPYEAYYLDVPKNELIRRARQRGTENEKQVMERLDEEAYMEKDVEQYATPLPLMSTDDMVHAILSNIFS